MITWNKIVLGDGDRSKLADSQDSFKFSYAEIDPRKENFSISATFEIEDASEGDFQSGYGIMVVDTVENPSNKSCYRNHLLVGRFRSVDGRNYSCGVRVVGGYTNHKALRRGGHRILDPSRLFPTQYHEDALKSGDKRRFQLEKTDEGFKASMAFGDQIETIIFPGHDFLLKQDRKRFYVGFAIAGDIKVRVSDIQFETGPGKLSRTPEGTIRNHIPDYPFGRSLLASAVSYADSDPADLASAILHAAPGNEIVLPDGVYKGGPYYIPESSCGEPSRPIILRAEHSGKAVIDGSGFGIKLPAMVLRGHHWIVEGIVFRNAPSCGLFVCGSDNLIKACEASHNGDTGILICSYPGVSKNEWPSRNRIEGCFSHDNCDSVRRNADGFGAKLSVGEGNGFYSCKASHNIDDGFDLYTKSTLGPIAPVTIDNCEASYNGWLSGEERPSGEVRTGIGFKLGGEYQRVQHLILGCAAHHNARAGFDANSNHAVSLSNCDAWDNPMDFKSQKKHDTSKDSCKELWKAKVLPWLMLNNPFLRNRHAARRFEAIIPELKFYEPGQVSTRLCRHALDSGYFSLDSYYAFVASDEERMSKLRRSLTFLGSKFFRGGIWLRLREVCREAFQDTSKDKVRIWCAGCSDGKEVYSLLMVLLDFLPAGKIDLLATDYNLQLIDKASKGIYPLEIIKEIPSEYRHDVETYLPEENERIGRLKLLISSRLREIPRFRHQNLLSDDYPGGFDLILCRNVIKFFEEDAMREVQTKLSASLEKGGFLVVSDDLKRESIPEPDSLGLAQIDNTCIYRKL
ncbi:MAG: right-handed parallel beta-helix repeat-containing protein [Bacteroidales bacterium]|nr:right-handed parallel beta-helix repeat-containing protein [Bacteroidales bacterium]